LEREREISYVKATNSVGPDQSAADSEKADHSDTASVISNKTDRKHESLPRILIEICIHLYHTVFASIELSLALVLHHMGHEDIPKFTDFVPGVVIGVYYFRTPCVHTCPW
jgi:hypothetical protein